jgi:hypothetical protein
LPSRSALVIGKGRLFRVGAIYQLTNSNGHASIAIMQHVRAWPHNYSAVLLSTSPPKSQDSRGEEELSAVNFL